MPTESKLLVKSIGPKGGVIKTVSFEDGISAMGWLRNPETLTLRREAMGAVLLAFYEREGFGSKDSKLNLVAVGITPEMNRRFMIEQVFAAALGESDMIYGLSLILRQTAETEYINRLPAMDQIGEKYIAARRLGSGKLERLLKLS